MVPGMWFPSYLMSISWRPLSVGTYFTVIVPSLLSLIRGRAILPEGIRTSPATVKKDHQVASLLTFRVFRKAHDESETQWNWDVWSRFLPVSAPCWTLKGMSRLRGRNIGCLVSTGTTGSLVACKEQGTTIIELKNLDPGTSALGPRP